MRDRIPNNTCICTGPLGSTLIIVWTTNVVALIGNAPRPPRRALRRRRPAIRWTARGAEPYELIEYTGRRAPHRISERLLLGPTHNSPRLRESTLARSSGTGTGLTTA
ncbi:hypothetical protein EVAR_75460_1 [Eumeta japonica]|uniref:Uncharacterized protein n=1 Tax=Eumeta variegata TaxID=151549 RepID=A0A4C1TJZ1_EUMVA|nr:hypothetical protein EVAR_75460_1 [Eumeta japonica]